MKSGRYYEILKNHSIKEIKKQLMIGGNTNGELSSTIMYSVKEELMDGITS